MKVFHRVLAMVLALVLSFAVLPLGTFASEPWVEVGSGTQTPSEGSGEAKQSLVVKVNADKLVEILQTTGISGALLDELTSGIVVDIASLLEVFTVEEILDIIPAEDMLGNIDMVALLNELGDKADVYFDLAALIDGLTDEELESIVKKDNAIDLIMEHYQNKEEGGVAALLDELLTANGDDVENCPIYIYDLADAAFWRADDNDKFFNRDELTKIEFEKYITTGEAEEGKVTIDHLLEVHWPKNADGTYDVSFLDEQNIHVTEFIKDLDAAGVDLADYIIDLDKMLDDTRCAHLVSQIEADPMAYLTAAGQTHAKNWVSANIESWELTDDYFNMVALAADFTNGDQSALESYFAANEDEVTAAIEADPGKYLSSETLDDLLEAVAHDIDFVKVLVLAEDEEDHSYLYDYVDLTKMMQENMSFLLGGESLTEYITPAGLEAMHTHIDDIYHLVTDDIGLVHVLENESLSTVVSCLNLTEVMNALNDDDPTTPSLADYVNLPLAIKAITVEKLLSIINNSESGIDAVIDVQAFIEAIGPEALIGQLDGDEIAEIWKLEAIQSAMSKMLTLILSEVLYDVNKISINGNVVAEEEDPSISAGRLMVDLNALLGSILAQIPTLEDIAKLEDGKLLSMDIALDYVADDGLETEADVTKEFTLEVVLDGDIEKVKSAAAQLNTILSTYVYYVINPDLSFVLELNIPEEIADIYADIIKSADIDAETKARILSLADASKDSIGFLETLTFEDVMSILKGIDTEMLFDKLAQIDYVDQLLAKLTSETGKDFSELSVSEILAALDDSIDKAGSNSLVAKVYSMIESKFGIDVTAILDDSDLTELDEIVEADRALYEDAFGKVKGYLLSAVDTIETLAPDLLSTTFGDMYQGDGKFCLETPVEKELEVQDIAVKLAEKFFGSQMELSDDMLDFVRQFFPSDFVLSAKVDLTVNFTNMYRVTYHGVDNAVVLDAFMPKGTELSVYEYVYSFEDDPDTKYVVNSWLSNGEIVETVTGDLSVYANFTDDRHTTVVFEDELGNVIKEIYKLKGSYITASDLADILCEKDVDPAYASIYEWVLTGWDLKDDGETGASDLSALPVVEGMVFTPVFEESYFDEVNGPHTEPTDDGYIISKDDLFAEVDEDGDGDPDAVIIPISDKLISEDASVTLQDPNSGVTIEIPAETLVQLSELENGDKITVKYDPNATFRAGYYHEGNAVQYTFDFLIGDNQVSYSELIGDDSSFANTVAITVPFDAITPAPGVGTHVYYVNGDERTLIESEIADTYDFVTIYAPHFSDFVIANEYAVYYRFESGNTDAEISGTVGFDEAHDVEGYTFLPVAEIEFTPTLISPESGYELVGAYVADSDDEDAEKTWTDGWTLEVTDKPVYLTVVAEYTVTFKVTFMFKRDVYKTVDVKYGKTIAETLGSSSIDPDSYFTFLNDTCIEYVCSKWVSEDGKELTYDPFTTPVTEDVTYLGRAEQAATYKNVIFKQANGDLFRSVWVKTGTSMEDGVWVKDGDVLSAADPSSIGTPAKTGDDTVRYDFVAWLNADGEATDVAQAVVNESVVYTPSYETSYRVFFVDEEGNTYYSIWVAENGTVKADDEYDATNPAKTAPEDAKYLFDYEFVQWTLDGAAFDLDTKITASIELVAEFTENYFIKEVNPDIKDLLTAEFDGDTYVVKVNGTFTTIKLPTVIGAYVNACENAEVDVVIVDEDGNTLYRLLAVKKALLEKLYADGTQVVSIKYEQATEFTYGIYNAGNASKYVFGFACDGTDYVLEADDTFTVRVPFEWLTVKDDNAKTTAYGVDGEVLSALDGNHSAKGTLNGIKIVQLVAEGGATFVVVNEYGLTDGGATHGDEDAPVGVPLASATITGFGEENYYVKGAEVIVMPTKVTSGYRVESIYYVDADGEVVELEKLEGYEAKWKLTVPDYAVTLVASIIPVEHRINYYVMVDRDGTVAYELVENYLYNGHALLADAAAVSAEHLAILEELLAAEGLYIPVAYEIDTWVGYDEKMLGTADMNVYLTFKPIDYTLNFVDAADESVVGSIVFNAETTDLGAFEIPNKVGHTGVCSDFASFDIQAAIAEMIANETTSTSLEVVYTPCTYTITYDETTVTVTGEPIYGNTITLEAIEKEFYKASVEVVTVNGTKVTVKDGAFTMPDASVKVTVTYTATGNTVYYINNRPCYGAMIGDVATFEIRFTKGYRVASVSEGCTLINSTVDGDMYVLVYAFDVTDGRRIEYTIEAVAYDDKNIINGSEYEGTGKPVVEEDKVTFEGWSASLLGSISFAIFGTENASCAICLWIVLALIVLIAVIAILYKLFKLGKLKNNFITRFVAWIASGFLAVCRFVARVGLAIFRFFGKNLDGSADEEAAEEACLAAPATEEADAEAEAENDEPQDNA